jgi:hypothetical protein
MDLELVERYPASERISHSFSHSHRASPPDCSTCFVDVALSILPSVLSPINALNVRDFGEVYPCPPYLYRTRLHRSTCKREDWCQRGVGYAEEDALGNNGVR